MKRAKTHKDVEFAVDDFSGNQRIFKKCDEAAGFAVNIAVAGRKVNLDVLVYSTAGARHWGGPDAVEQYKEDEDASVFERFEITVNPVGRVY